MPKKKTKPKTRKPAAKSKPRRKTEVLKTVTLKTDPNDVLTMVQPLIDELANQAADIKSALANIAGLQNGLRSTVERLAKVDVLAQSQQAIVASLGTRAATWQAVESLERKIEALANRLAEFDPGASPFGPATEIISPAPDPEPAPLELSISVEPEPEMPPAIISTATAATLTPDPDALEPSTIEPPSTDEFDLT